ncbi:methyltransferase domain-containing protein [Fulvivirgaceae bacterium BMA12]|uniref:Methyltransferase domain-containing protein n=1 Tax=Agaribacillus aureus TaxID=3051825 RepID=A0ABT8L712_9BACT|nr:methyltransferase domain-containing protein [Fulvivirgaceae bacterium BMA12]
MAVAYDKYYQTANLFGDPYPELIDFFKNYPQRGQLLDMGCGQGRDAIPLARLGYNVTGVDHSKVGIAQMKKTAQAENLSLKGMVVDIYQYDHFSEFDFILLDSMFHFTRVDKKKETDLVKRILLGSRKDAVIVFCLQHTGNKVSILNKTIDAVGNQKRIFETDLAYNYQDTQSGHSSTTNYKMIVTKH